jgi:hypothetical protein
MKPTIEEIKRALPTSDPEDQFVYIESDEAAAPGLIESLVIRIREFTVKLFRLPRFKKIVFIAIMSLAAFDGFQVCVPNKTERDIVIQNLKNSQQWTLNIQAHAAPELQKKYFIFGSPGDPTPIDVTFTGPNSTIFAPITGSAVIPQNITYRPYDPNRGIS